MKKRLGALLLAVAVTVTSVGLGQVTVDAKSKGVVSKKEALYVLKDENNAIAYIKDKKGKVTIRSTVKIAGKKIAVTKVMLDDGEFNSRTTHLVLPKTIRIVSTRSISRFKKLKKITIKKSNTKFKMKKGLLLSKGGTKLYSILKTRKNVTVPSGVKEVKSWAGAYGNVKEISLPSTCKKVGKYAFYKAKKLRYIYMTDNVKFGKKAYDKNKVMLAMMEVSH